MKKYQVFMEIGEGWSPSRKYVTDDIKDAFIMRDLLAKQDDKHEYVVMETVDRGVQ